MAANELDDDRSIPSWFRCGSPLPPPPRRVALTRGVITGLVIALTAVVALFAMALVLEYRLVTRLERLRDHGQVMTGIAIGKSEVPRRRGTDYRVDYEFTIDGRTIGDHENLPFGDWIGIAAREPVDVTFMPGDPDVHLLLRVTPKRLERTAREFAVYKVLWAGMAAVTSVILAFFYRGRLRLLRTGIETSAVIESVGSPSGSSALRRIVFHIQAPDGTSRKKTLGLPRDAVGPDDVGRTVPFLIDPLKPNPGLPIIVILKTCRLQD